MTTDYRSLFEEHISSASHLSKRHVHPRLLKLFEVGGMNTAFRHAKDVYLYDTEGRRYLDFLAGGGVYFIGRNHPEVNDAIQAVLDMDLPNLCVVNASVLGGVVAEQLLELAGPHLTKVVYANSGTEATDVCVRFARVATGRRRYLYLEGAFHGRSYAAISMCGFEALRERQEPLMPTCTPIPPNDIDALRRELRRGDVAGFIFESVQGMTTISLDDGYLREARTLCDEYGTLMIADEVQTGLGRTGHWFGMHASGVRPDMVTVSKTLSGGAAPVSAVLYTEELYEKIYTRFTSGPFYFSTFAENNISMAASLATLNVLKTMDAPKRANEIAKRLNDGLKRLASHYDVIERITGKGLMIAIYFRESSSTALRVQQELMNLADRGSFAASVNVEMYTKQRVVVQIPGPGVNAIKILPPVVSTDADIDYFLAALEDSLASLYSLQRGPATTLSRGFIDQTVKAVKGIMPQAASAVIDNARGVTAATSGHPDAFARPAGGPPAERLFARPTTGVYAEDLASGDAIVEHVVREEDSAE